MIRLAMLRDSLRLRLLAGTLAWIAVSIAVAGWGLDGLFRRHIEQQFDAELKTHLDQLTANLAFDENGQPSVPAPLSDPRLSRPFSGLYWQIDRVDGDGRPLRVGLLRSRSLWDATLAVPADALDEGAVHRHRIAGPQGKSLGALERMLFPAGRPDQPLRLVVAADAALMNEPADRFGGMLWLALAILGAGLTMAAVVQLFISMAPLRRLHGALSAVRGGQSQQLQGSFPVEIRPLVKEFNSVLGQNAEIVARARQQSGNLAHALKTPLSVLANAAAAEDSELARLVGEQVETARRQVEYHLGRARVAAVRVPGMRTPVMPALQGLARVMQRVHAERELDLQIFPAAENPAFHGEEQDLQEMLGNLLDNACKWARRRIEVRVAPHADQLIITVDDDGQGLSATSREAMLQRGTRADEHVAGSGLGLAIVDDLARLYGGAVSLSDSLLGGLQATLRLPAASSD